jgi:hypothetical protein
MTPNERTYKVNTQTQLREILYTISQDMLVQPSTVVSRYYNCCTDGSTSPEITDTPSYDKLDPYLMSTEAMTRFIYPDFTLMPRE